MRRIFCLSVLFTALMIGEALAACSSGTRVSFQNIISTLENKLICATSPSNGKRWAEEHFALSGNSGQLWEHAKGSNNKVDPRRQAGTWRRGGNANTGGTVIYNYTGNPPGNPYTWSLWQTSSQSVDFCTADGATLIASAKLIAIPAASDANPCGF
jgi:hypothetical protein